MNWGPPVNTEMRTHDRDRQLWVWSRDGKPFFVTSLAPHGLFGGYMHILLAVARREYNNNNRTTQRRFDELRGIIYPYENNNPPEHPNCRCARIE